ncbi:hypothetical protein OEV98_05705 [Caldibacillus lycopersici]|uniref:Uncharacterized protein n=1 Tax=Perspicuibacillus lycopersici TaxID=1325689 RepID=A0AAE3LQ46_9BACI|nr:hypothetical protein [Perspicuibacillus lycopersici]MCU9613044.1 hypothetical protein [Perspicuibacillus lycopersici]
MMKLFEDVMTDHALLDMIASIQYPFYVVFRTPLFGLNYLFAIRYATFSLVMSAVYVFAFIFILRLQKVNTQNG